MFTNKFLFVYSVKTVFYALQLRIILLIKHSMHKPVLKISHQVDCRNFSSLGINPTLLEKTTINLNICFLAKQNQLREMS